MPDAPFRSWLRCFGRCSNDEYPLEGFLYRCPRCHDLLEVGHDFAALATRSGDAWKALFDARYKRTEWPYGSGVWGKKEWVGPTIDSTNVVSLDEGGTNLFWAERYGRVLGLDELWIKMCGNSHSGSFKDLGMTVLVSVVKQMIARGTPVRAVVCASTGDTSASLAAYCAVAGIPSVVLLPRGKISTAQLVQPLANGSRVLALDTDFDGCMEIVQQLVAEPGVYLANSLNPLRIEGQKTVAVEIVQQFDWAVPDWVIIPGGNLGNVSALGSGFQMMRDLGLVERLPRIAVAQVEAANPLYLAYQRGFAGGLTPVHARPTQATAIQIGNPVSYPRAVKTIREFNGVVEQASEDELADAAARADQAGLYCDPHTGVALAVLEKLVARREILPAQRVVVISTASGLKFNEFKVGYHDGTLPAIASRRANRPIELAARYGDVRAAVFSRDLVETV